ncbi:hypothetical protein JOF28_001966 [Leucobacter exalbidus]|uniref:Uncharacterized protein n=1 Tax=Leucobacter exalbidus TaxID=662960 RepID=A0A940PSK4_9MICO|nr:hypothetical protein [Leucobacter exalbidus]MBP1326734.1 hypothetical protein [Leucobacter exalbidus]
MNSSRELQALILSIRRSEKEVQAQIRKHTKPMVQSAWQQGLAQHASTRFEHKVLVETARVAVSNQNVKLKSGGLAKKLSGGGRARELYVAAEFGADQNRETQYGQISKNGKRYSVTRHSARQLRPRNKKGYVVYPTAAEIIPRLAALWTQTAVRTLYEAFEKKG